jgi:hypothetical protein
MGDPAFPLERETLALCPAAEAAAALAAAAVAAYPLDAFAMQKLGR